MYFNIMFYCISHFLSNFDFWLSVKPISDHMICLLFNQINEKYYIMWQAKCKNLQNVAALIFL